MPQKDIIYFLIKSFRSIIFPSVGHKREQKMVTNASKLKLRSAADQGFTRMGWDGSRQDDTLKLLCAAC